MDHLANNLLVCPNAMASEPLLILTAVILDTQQCATVVL